MLPVVALIGRPNVGKSTLFNCLTGTRDALVADFPGLTRDRQYGTGRIGARPYIVIDTGGLVGAEKVLDGVMATQVWRAVEEADAVLFLLDARDGINLGDQQLAARLHRSGRPVWPVLNKTDTGNPLNVMTEACALGFGEPAAIAAAHGRGVAALMDRVLAGLPDTGAPAGEAPAALAPGIRVAVVGRPNVGKSTLVNRMLGEERVIAYDQPGTTRDSIYIPFERDGQAYTLIDTAGVRRRARVSDRVEKFSIVKTLQAISDAEVVVLVLDAHEEVAEQDAALAGHIVEQGRALVLAVNKWDGLADDDRDAFRRQLERRLPFLGFAETHFVSALHGSGVGHLFEAVRRAHAAATIDIPTARLTRLLEAAVQAHQPPLVRGRRIKLRYAHQGGHNPPIVVVHGNQTERLPESYRRYLMNYLIDALKLTGTPLRLQFKTGDNPYKGKRNTLTPRQQHRRKRMLRHVKKS